MAVHRFVYRVVEDFPDEVMQAGRADAANVRARNIGELAPGL